MSKFKGILFVLMALTSYQALATEGQQNSSNTRPKDLIIGGMVAGSSLEVLLLAAKYGTLKDLDKFVVNHPGFAIIGVSSIAGFGWMVQDMFFKKNANKPTQNSSDAKFQEERRTRPKDLVTGGLFAGLGIEFLKFVLSEGRYRFLIEFSVNHPGLGLMGGSILTGLGLMYKDTFKNWFSSRGKTDK